MRIFILLATAWGPKFGGINAFNQDFAIGLQEYIGNAGKVYCAVPNATTEDIESAAKDGITILPIADAVGSGDFDRRWTDDAYRQLGGNITAEYIVWIGHDVKTGFAAVYASDKIGGRCALIMHMDYLAYQGLMEGGETAWSKHEKQRSLFRSPAALFAVGPLLRRSCNRLTGTSRAHMLVPGFPPDAMEDAHPSNTAEAEPHRAARTNINVSPDDMIAAITLGRLDIEHDKLKQGQLAVAAFSRAVAKARSYRGPAALVHGYLSIIGIDSDDASRAALLKQSESHSSSIVNILPAAYSEDRDYTLFRVRSSNLAMILSWHEGFGLTAWEAIAYEVPLILSRNSGIYQLIEDELGGAGVGCLNGVRIDGSHEPGQSFSDKDYKRIAKSIIRVGSNIASAKRDAQVLKGLLIEKIGCSWRNTAEQFLAGLPRAIVPGQNDGAMQVPIATKDDAASPNDQAELSPLPSDIYPLVSLEDAKWTPSGPNALADKMILGLKSLTWGTQNRQLSLVADGDALRDASKTQLLVLGRNLYQAACGNAHAIVDLIKDFSNKSEIFGDEASQLIFQGMLMEIYFDPTGKIRNVPKAGMIEAVFSTASLPKFRPATEEFVSFLRTVAKPGRFPVLPGSSESKHVMQCKFRSPMSEGDLWILQDIYLDSMLLVSKSNAPIALSPADILRQHGDKLFAATLRDVVASYFAVPRSRLSMDIEPDFSFAIDDKIYLIGDQTVELEPNEIRGL